MLLEKRLELMNYRMEMAKERLDSAHILWNTIILKIL